MAADAELVVKISADISDIKKKLDDATKSTKGFSVGGVAAGTALGITFVELANLFSCFRGLRMSLSAFLS